MAISYVGRTGSRNVFSGTGSTTWTVTVATAPGAGSLLVLAAADPNSNPPSGVTDSRGNTWTVQTSATTNGAVAWTTQNAAALQVGDLVTLTYPANVFTIAAIIDEFAGIAASSPIDVSGTATFTASTSRTAPSETTSNAADLIYAAFVITGAAATETSFTAGSGYTAVASGGFISNNGATVEAEYQIVSSTGSYAPTGTGSLSAAGRGITVAFKAAAAALQTVTAVGGINSSLAFGVATVFGAGASLQTVTGAGAIFSRESFGDVYGQAVYGSAVYASSKLSVRRVVRPTGVATSQAFGNPTINVHVNPPGGTQTVSGVGAISSAQAFGTPTKSPQIIRGQGIVSAQAVGTPTLIGAGAYPALFGHAKLSDTPAFAAASDDTAPFAARTDDTTIYAAALDDAMLYTQQVTDALVYAGTEDDTQ